MRPVVYINITDEIYYENTEDADDAAEQELIEHLRRMLRRTDLYYNVEDIFVNFDGVYLNWQRFEYNLLNKKYV